MSMTKTIRLPSNLHLFTGDRQSRVSTRMLEAFDLCRKVLPENETALLVHPNTGILNDPLFKERSSEPGLFVLSGRGKEWLAAQLATPSIKVIAIDDYKFCLSFSDLLDFALTYKDRVWLVSESDDSAVMEQMAT